VRSRIRRPQAKQPKGTKAGSWDGAASEASRVISYTAPSRSRLIGIARFVTEPRPGYPLGPERMPMGSNIFIIRLRRRRRHEQLMPR
jgi:hypothetical protein